MPTRISRAKLTTDIVLAGVFALVCLPFALLGGVSDVLILVVFAGALAVRRYDPGWSLAIAWVAALAQMLLLRDLQLYDAAVLGVLYSTAAHGGRVVKWLGLGSAGVGAVLATAYLAWVKPLIDGATFAAPQDTIGTVILTGVLFVASIAVLVLAWTAGLLVRAVRDTREVRRREEVANRERELAEYRWVVEQERNRIARDMHDVVAHSLAVVIAQADGARFAARTKPESAVDALGTIAGVARGALGDVRLLLAELRHHETESPQPVLDDLGVLLDQVRAAGLDIRLDEHGVRPELGTGQQIAVYRIVQEGLTNALRHGDAAQPVQLALRWDDAGVTVELVNARRADVPPPDSHAFRHGIPGMRERAQLAGGTLQAVAGDDGLFRLTARIPARTGRTA
ncbi:sensor histidine kinase [Agromyces sp. S2-1-8]|uniref:sensor histidine kinase n=1 Tax=Agromyces sp. S2-1-8 TaxID=2897180 RepID=UPI001E44B5CC|nr:histidine kinase [Agromyces sp. S2-1-8]MCD5347305.1 histidine kinase [Agromyces sp. S2-1-8]